VPSFQMPPSLRLWASTAPKAFESEALYLYRLAAELPLCLEGVYTHAFDGVGGEGEISQRDTTARLSP